MKTTCPHCTQHLSHEAPKEITAIACPTCGQPVLLQPARNWLWLRCLGYAAAVVVFILIFSGVVGGMERDRAREDRRAEALRRQQAEFAERIEDARYSGDPEKARRLIRDIERAGR